MRFFNSIALAVLAAGAAPSLANITTVTFSGSVYELNGMPVTPVAGSVVGTITLSDGSDPFGPPATPDNFTGTVMFSDFFSDPGNATFSYSTPLFGGDFLDDNPYHSAAVTFVHGRLTGFDLFTDGDGDTFDIGASVGLGGGAFEHDLMDDDRNVIASYSGSFYLDSFSPSGTPEPATWALLVAGFGLVGGRLRRRPRGVPAAA